MGKRQIVGLITTTLSSLAAVAVCSSPTRHLWLAGSVGRLDRAGWVLHIGDARPRLGNASASPEQDVSNRHKDLGRASHQWPRIDGSDYLVTDPRVPPLIRAIAAGDVELASKLIASGADPNVPDPYGMTALMVAAN